MYTDLHIHTTHSDGVFSPEQIVKYAKKNGLKAISITDHDSMDGVEEAVSAGEKYGIEVIRGIELSVDTEDDEIHILGYFKKSIGEDLKNYLDSLKQKRIVRAQRIIDKLNNINIEITMDDVVKFTGSEAYIGRPHIALAMIEKGYIENKNEAFDKYLCVGGLGYVERDNNMDSQSAIDLIHNNDGISVIAHPGLAKCRDITSICIEQGIMGIEVFHSSHDSDQIKHFEKIAMDKNMIITGGSDYHGHGDKIPELGRFKLDYKYFKNLKEAF